MIDIIKLSVVLTVISVIAALAIAATNVKTRDLILEQQRLAESNALQQIMPEGVKITEKSGQGQEPQQYWVGTYGDETLYAFKIASRGYSSDINYFVSVTPEGIIKGMAVLEQGETPGLGSRVQEVISKKYVWNGLFGKKEAGSHWFTEQFSGINISQEINIDKSNGEWHKLDESQRQKLQSSNAITAITGSTISTRAVTRGLQTQARAYLNAIQG